MLPKALHSIQDISVQYMTGDLPVLVLCSDKEYYICKYVRPSATIAYKLACEFIGTILAEAWRINTPPSTFVHIAPIHWNTITTPHSVFTPAIGFRKLDNVIDVTPTTYKQVKPTNNTLFQLLRIALFDFWVANEDRTYNNANMLYNVVTDQLISIDYGGIFNNVTYDYPLAQLTESDSILCADVFTHIAQSTSVNQLNKAIILLKQDFPKYISHSKHSIENVVDKLPVEWSIPTDKISNKLNELFSSEWIDATWNNFIECLTSNSNYGK